MTEYFTCPICGTDVPIKARACPECGSDDETGWSAAAQYTHLLPDRGDEGGYKRSAWRQYMIPVAAVIGLSGVLMAAGFLGAALLVPLVVGGIRLGTWFSNRREQTHSRLEHQAYERLLRQAAGDRSMADRLIELERQRSPQATRLQLIQDALYRWRRDRH
ncbi:MAG: zinc ribbon domain-containing protein [Leptolyngbyaceae bacterium]|nr:zinc ribbon domain-containing protein [Leptolyngbyaceae bacterium]